MIRVLVCESNAQSALFWKSEFEKKQYWLRIASSRQESFSLLKDHLFHFFLLPIEKEEDLESLLVAKSIRPECSIIVLSPIHDPKFVVECIRGGASDYWQGDVTPEVCSSLLEKNIKRLFPNAAPLLESDLSMQSFIGRDPKILEIYQTIHKIKDSDATVLITGESGTGKELVTKAIHNLSQRKNEPCVAVNCSAIPANLLESELFGHVKGAFTGAIQNRVGRFQVSGQGTIFLDEIGDLPLELQAKLLRVLQQKTYEPVGSTQSLTLHARIIAATNQDLEKAVMEKRFREDLYYRLNVIPIHTPSLRSRRGDIPLLVRNFIQKFSAQNSKKILGISEESMRALMQYHWPGNVRELENLIERVVILKQGNGIVELSDFPPNYFKNIRLDRFVATVSLPDDGLQFNDAVNAFENELILQALRKTQGNKNKAASLLGLNRTTLVEKLKRKGLQVE